ncbi:heme peroxidase [Moniliophthora roreri MCA 2997]|uniref:Heme peroxidase n=2 Tax=Moniliophthora roreri TaxID=221103 RepID=V2XZS1_MONRO|nr:heme peroxidase [Moniliophthora roreri MCA 2997]
MSLNRKSSVFERAKMRRADNVSTDTTSTAQGAANGSNPKGKMLKDLTEQVKKGLPLGNDHSALSAVLDAIRHSESVDDRKLLLEYGLSFISNLPPGEFQQEAQDRVIKLLYNDLCHPPATCIGNKYAWRTADGSFNNVSIPEMGKAGEPYARSVQQAHPLSNMELPDPGLIFDTLLKRDGFVKHPAGLSSLMFSFAALVIHTCFRTSHTDVNINETSSYVDLSPLYGHDQDSQDKIRMRDGRGFLFPDVFAEDRLLLLPPAVCVILVLFSRNHNYIAEKLLEINERGTFRDPSKIESREELMKQDEELFQTARLVNCGWFGSAVFSDYVSCILGLVRQGSNWTLDPFGEIRNADHSTFERGQGNVCSVEFNCLYRWHATTSVEDEKWVDQVFENIFEGKSPEQVTPQDFKAAAKKVQAMTPDIQHWTFGGLQRQEDGTFRDEDLANALKNATEHPAGAFRARGTPASMRLHEMMGIMQNRQWGVCSLNDFRRYLGLKPYSSFLEWNPDPEIAYAAEKLYGNIEYLELYVGLQAEEAKPVVDGAGLCPGYTISRAILSDAIALTRGDRYFTHDYTPFNLTSWGFADCQRDPDAYGFGSTLGRLFLRTLPNQFSENSSYAFFPLMTPESMKQNLKNLKKSDQYDLVRPVPTPSYQVVSEYSQVGDILKSSNFTAPQYQERAHRVIKGKGFFSTAESREEQQKVVEVLSSPEGLRHTCKYFFEQTIKLIESNSWTLPNDNTCIVDLVRDVFKTVPVYWVAELAGIPLKSSSSDSGAFTPNELFEMLGDIYSFIFLDVETSRVRVLQAKVEAHVETLTDHIETGLHLGLKRLSVAGILDTVSSFFSKGKQNEQHVLVKKLQDLGHSNDHLTNTILAIMVGAVPELALALTNMINLILDSPQEDVVRGLVNDANANLAVYAKESLRMDPPFKGVFRVGTNDQTISGLSLSKGSKTFLDIATACQNAEAFPNPQSFEVNRATKHHLFTDDGIYRCLGESLTEKIMGEVLRAVFSLKDIARAPGMSGQLKRFKDKHRIELQFAYLNQAKKISPWPTSMCVQYKSQ